MSEHQRQTAFLRHCLRYDDSLEHQALDKRIAQLQREDRCVRQAVWLMAVVTALAVASLGYAIILFENFKSQRIVQIISAVGLASLTCLVVFVGLRLIYRTKLDRRREEYRQLVTRTMRSRLDQSVNLPLQDSRIGDGQGATVSSAAKANGISDKIEPAAQR